MKRIGLIFTTIVLFAVSLYVAYQQGVGFGESVFSADVHLAATAAPLSAGLSDFWLSYLNVFAGMLSNLTITFGGSLLAAVIALAFIVELATLYPAVNIQIKQKKIHMFHKKLVDRFNKGELSMGQSKHELAVLYSVNERIHVRGALLITFQMLAFLAVLGGLNLVSLVPSSLEGAFSSFNFALLAKPATGTLPLLVALAYVLHALVKIHLKQREDYIGRRQTLLALGFAALIAGVVFYFASVFAVLLSVYFLTQITFATMRYIIVEENSKEWGKHVQRELIKLLRTSKVHRNRTELWSRKFNHLPVVRHLNFQLLEEALSMSLAMLIAVNVLALA